MLRKLCFINIRNQRFFHQKQSVRSKTISQLNQNVIYSLVLRFDSINHNAVFSFLLFVVQ